MWRRLGALILKELRGLWNDRRTRFVLVGPPLVQLLLFAHAATFDLDHLPVVLWDEDRTALSREFLAGIEGAKVFGPLYRVQRKAELDRLIDTRSVAFALRIREGFAADLSAGRPARVQLLLDGRQTNTALGILAYIQRIADSFSVRQLQSRGLQSRIETRAWFNPNLESRWFVVPGLVGILTQVITLAVTALGVARERELGTFERLLVTPLRPVELMLGKTLPALIVGLGEGLLIFIVGITLFAVPFLGRLEVLLAGLALFMLGVAGVGLSLSAISHTQQQAIVWAFLFMAPSVVLSGFATPIENMPPLIRAITWINPLRWMIEILRSTFLRALGFADLALPFAMLALIALVSLTAATVIFRRRVA